MRGLSAGYTGKTSMALVFPPLAGVIGKSANIVVYRVGIPPSAGVIGAVRGIVTGSVGIPPVCGGLSVNVLLIYECGDVFPPRLRGLSEQIENPAV